MFKLLSRIKVILSVLFILALIACIYIMVDMGNMGDIISIYESLGTNPSKNVNKKIQFLESYTQVSGDLTLALNKGLTTDDIETILEGGSMLSPAGDNVGNKPNNMELASDYLNLASAIANCMRTPGTNTFSYSQSRPTDPKPDGWSSSVEFNGITHKGTHRDCSCFVSAFVYLIGKDPTYVHRTSIKFYQGQWGNLVSVTKFSEMEIGDVIAKDGHVAIVVNKDDEKIYFADAGNTGYIEATYNQGYAQTFPLDGNVSTWRSGEERVFRLN